MPEENPDKDLYTDVSTGDGQPPVQGESLETVDFDNDPRSQINIQPDSVPDDVVSWQASEFIHHKKDFRWYVLYIVAAVVLVAGLYLFLKDLFSIIMLAVVAVSVGIYAGREPRTLKYQLDDEELTINGKSYSLDDFRSFSVTRAGAISSITFMPAKRFMVPITIYFSDADSEQIMGLLGPILPHEEHKPDLIDRLIRNLRF